MEVQRPIPQPTTSSSKATSKTITLLPAKYLYVHLSPITASGAASASQIDLDDTTLKLHLLAALTGYLGDTGAAIPVDILSVRRNKPSFTTGQQLKQLDKSTNGAQGSSGTETQIIVRLYRDDGPAFMAAVASWVGGGTRAAPGAASGSSAQVVGYVVKNKTEWLVDLLGCADSDINGLFDFAH